MLPNQPSSSRKKVRHTRSKHGCGVCRVRRVRCDQARPACVKCTSTGRKCDGFPDQTIIPYPPLIGFDNTLSMLPTLLPSEAIALRHFQDRTSRDLAGIFGDDFWQSTILQLSMRHRCIRNVTIALACLQGYLQPGRDMLASAQTLRSTALSYYASGITDLNMHINIEGWFSLEVVLACSVLCIMFEWRQDNHSLALRHLYSSLGIIKQWEKAATSSQRQAVRPSINSPKGHFISSTLGPMLRRMFAQNISLIHLGALTIPEVPQPNIELKDFNTPREAFESLVDLLTLEYAFPESELSQDAARRQMLTLQDVWSEKLDGLLRRLPTEDPSVAVQVMQLEIWRRNSRLLALRRFALDQPVYTTHGHLLEEMLDLCIKISSLKTSKFSADVSLVPALYFIAFNSRDLAIRWKAVSILEGTSRREGIWDSKKAALLARRSILQDEQEKYEESDGLKRLWDLRVEFNNEGSVWP